MYGERVYVKYNGKLEEVMVACNPHTPYDELREMALDTLRKRDEKKEAKRQAYIWDNLEQIIERQWNRI